MSPLLQKPCCLHKELSIMEAQSPKSKKFVGWWWLIHPCRCWAEPKHCGHFLTYMYIMYLYIYIYCSSNQLSKYHLISLYTYIYSFLNISNLKISKVLQISNSAHPFFIWWIWVYDLHRLPPSLHGTHSKGITSREMLTAILWPDFFAKKKRRFRGVRSLDVRLIGQVFQGWKAT